MKKDTLQIFHTNNRAKQKLFAENRILSSIIYLFRSIKVPTLQLRLSFITEKNIICPFILTNSIPAKGFANKGYEK